jgi:hypothetical protein
MPEVIPRQEGAGVRDRYGIVALQLATQLEQRKGSIASVVLQATRNLKTFTLIANRRYYKKSKPLHRSQCDRTLFSKRPKRLGNRRGISKV